MCEQTGEEIDWDRCPPDSEDFPESTLTALNVFHTLGDRIGSDVGYIGKDFTKWDGDPGKKSRLEIDHKKISVLIDGSKQEMRLRKLNDNSLWLTLTLNSYSCAQAKTKVPSRFINKNYYKEYISDFY